MAENGEKGKLLSPALMGFLRRRAMEVCGLLLILAGGALTAMLFSPGRLDPSWSAFSPGPVNNWFGPVGAAIAGGLRTSLGAASFFATLLPLGWGYRLLRKQEIGQRVARLFLAPVALLLLASGIYGLSGGAGSAAGGAAGVVLLGLTMPHVPPVPSVLGLGMAHYIGAGYALLGLMLWSWSVTLARRQWALLVMPVRMLAKLVGRVLRPRRAEAEDGGEDAPALELTETSEPVAEAGKAVAKKRPRKAAGKKKRQEPTIIDTGGDTAVPAAPATGQGRLDFGGDGQFRLPPAKLLKSPGKATCGLSKQELEATAVELETVLGDFSVKGEITESRYGPVVTRHDLEPAPGTKSQRVISLADDIARSMSAVSVRVAVVPGKNVIGIELPNEIREKVLLRELFAARAFGDAKERLLIALGKDIAGAPIVANLARMPHLLIAGTTGSGKSVAINVMILSLLYRLSPKECRMIMIDPKMLELSVYDGIPHLLSPVVTDPKKAVVALKWTVAEMEDRYRKMSRMGVRNIEGYNQRVRDAVAKGEAFTRTVQTGFDDDTGEPVYETQEFEPEELPFIVVVVDEMADLMMVAGKEIEACIQRLAQMARASGIHIIMATQRPSVDVITGTIKANFPTRISFQVTSKIDSRTILGEMGAEQLLGMGDMLYMAGGGRVTRVHGPFVSDEEVEEVVMHLKAQGEPSYIGGVTDGPDEEQASEIDAVLGLSGDETESELYDRAVAIVARDRKCSTSYIQRKLAIGYQRAARLVEQMEEQGVVSPANKVGKREIMVGEV